MADFATWASACEDGLGLLRGEFLKVYEANHADARNLALDSSPLYEPLRELAREGFRGSTMPRPLSSTWTWRTRRWSDGDPA